MGPARASQPQHSSAVPLGVEERLELLAEASRILTDASLEPPAVLERLCSLVVPALGQACALRLLSPDGEWLLPMGSAHVDPGSRESFQALMSGPQRADEGLSALVVRKGEALCLSSLSPEVLHRVAAPALKAVVEHFIIHDLLILPLRARGRVLGTLSVARGLNGRAFEDAERTLLQELADRAAVALEVAHAYIAERRERQSAEQSADRSLRLQRAAAALSEAVTPSDVAGVMMREAMDALGADQGVVSVASEDPSWMEILGSRNLPPGSLERLSRFPADAPLPAAEVYRGGTPLWMETPEVLTARFPTVLQRPEIMTQAVASLPLRTRGRTLGCCSLGFLAPRTFTEGERAFLLELAGQTAQALERARLYVAEQLARTRAQRAAERTTRLQAVIAELSPAYTAARVAEVVVDHGVSAVGARTGGLWLLEPDGTHARLVRSIGHSQEVVERFHRLPLSLDAPLMEALRKGRPVWVEAPEAAVQGATASSQPRGKGGSALTPSLACLPLRAEERTLGALVLGFAESRRFDADERAFLELLVHPAAEALARARLLEQQQAAQVALREAHQTMLSIFQASPAAIVLMDPDGTVRLWNAAAAHIFGWAQEEVLGRVLPVVPPDKLEEARQNLARTVRGEPVLGFETRRQRKDGTLIDVAMWASAVRHGSGEVQCAFIITDITERKRSEDAQRFLARAGSELASSLDDEATLERMAHLAVPDWADTCSIHLREGNQLRCVATAYAGPVPLAAREEPESSAVARVLASGMPELRAEAGPPPQAWLRVPLVVRHHVVGVLSFTRARRAYDARDLALAQELGRQAALTFDNARLYQEAQQAIRLREEFLSVASHELKTPISALQLQVQSLLSTLSRSPSGPTPERLRRSLETVQRQVHRQTQLINELLDVSRISAGRLQLQIEALELSALAREVAERFEPELTRAGSALRLQLAADTAGQWDRLRLDQVVTNLLSNAVKYGRGNPIQLTTEVTGSHVRLTLQDGGIGIAAEDLTRLFNRFERAVSERNYGGFGLGLWIARQSVEAMGGHIHVTSELGVGSTFTVELPRAQG
ncbi:GAF domain-containing protein [Hyalangium rubrum]|uniref:histidine kinase n=1 Tax=Hyalangium rubrum TaxID=3103134 RepID=A0ABU5GYS6_9BACT|nr:GAF domain-containing protein [Hyalangium sp. s54d21]MDY7226201.1 GAF domain-containing protein [Hyalangium sp. s54d21]